MQKKKGLHSTLDLDYLFKTILKQSSKSSNR